MHCDWLLFERRGKCGFFVSGTLRLYATGQNAGPAFKADEIGKQAPVSGETKDSPMESCAATHSGHG